MANNTKKKILIFSLVYYPRFIGGAEVAIKEITNRLGNLYEFDMITLRKEAECFERVGKVNVYRVGFGWRASESSYLARFKIYKYFFPFFAFFKAIRLHRKNNYDIIWSMMANYAGFAAVLFKFFNPKVPFLLTLQEGDPIARIKRKVWFIYPLFRSIFTHADKIQAISHFLADFGKSMGHSKPIEVIANGVDLDVFSKETSENIKNDVKNKLNKKPDDIYLVTTSRLVHKNATDDTISALVYLPKNVSFIIIGKGMEGARLQKQAMDLGLKDRVKFLGFIPYTDIPKYFSVCDIFARPSRSEGFGNSFIEAMAAGLPVIATPVGGIPDFLDDKETGVFCSPDNPQSIAEAVKLLINDQTLRKHMIEKAKARVIERYSWEHIANLMKTEVFDKISK